MSRSDGTLPLFPSSGLFFADPPRLRPYQSRAIQTLRNRVREGKRRILLVGPTGCGKAVIISGVIRTSTVPALFVCHRLELIDQQVEQLAQVGLTNVGVIRSDDERTNPSATIQVASIQTLARRDKPPAGLVFIDECFPAGTLVDGRPIETVLPGDRVSSFDPTTGTRCVRRVVRVFRNKPSSMVRLTADGLTLTCTSNHRIWTRNGWIKAEDSFDQDVAVAADHLRLMRKRNEETSQTHEHQDVMRYMHREPEGSKSEEGARCLQGLLETDGDSRERFVASTHRFGLLQRPPWGQQSTCADETINLRCLREGNRKTSATQKHSDVLSSMLLREKREEKKIHHSSVCCLRCHSHWKEQQFEQKRSSLLLRGAQEKISEPIEFENPCRVQSQTRSGENASPQPDARRQHPSEDGIHASLDRSSSTLDRGQRARTDEATANHARCSWTQLEARTTYRDEGDNRFAEMHLHRPCKRIDQTSDRDRRIFSRSFEDEESRRAQGVISSWARVGRIEVLEPGSDGTFGGVCPDGLVYNIEVEGTHTYFANGIAVSNCHRAVSDSYLSLLDHYKDSIILGFTATPTRYDGRPLGNLFECLEIVTTYETLIKDGFIVAPLCYSGPMVPDLSSIPNIGGDYDEDALGEVMRDRALVGQLLEHWLKLAHLHPTKDGRMIEGERRRTIIFAVTIQHSLDICERFSSAGVKIAHLDGTTPETQRRQIIRALGDGTLDAVTNVGIMLEGVDVPSAKCVVHARPTHSLVLHRQSTGRILRPWHPGCRRGCLEHPSVVPLLIDHAQNIQRHGFPHEDLHWELTSKARPIERKIPTRICKACYAYFPAYRTICPHCGAECPPVPPSDLPRENEEQLQKFVNSPEEMRRMYFNMIVQVARAKGYKPGFASARYKTRYGMWPPWEWSSEVKASFASDPEWQANMAANTKRKQMREVEKMAREAAKIEEPDD